jgi:hypothetical protein
MFIRVKKNNTCPTPERFSERKKSQQQRAGHQTTRLGQRRHGAPLIPRAVFKMHSSRAPRLQAKRTEGCSGRGRRVLPACDEQTGVDPFAIRWGRALAQ